LGGKPQDEEKRRRNSSSVIAVKVGKNKDYIKRIKKVEKRIGEAGRTRSSL